MEKRLSIFNSKILLIITPMWCVILDIKCHKEISEEHRIFLLFDWILRDLQVGSIIRRRRKIFYDDSSMFFQTIRKIVVVKKEKRPEHNDIKKKKKKKEPSYPFMHKRHWQIEQILEIYMKINYKVQINMNLVCAMLLMLPMLSWPLIVHIDEDF